MSSKGRRRVAPEGKVEKTGTHRWGRANGCFADLNHVRVVARGRDRQRTRIAHIIVRQDAAAAGLDQQVPADALAPPYSPLRIRNGVFRPSPPTSATPQ